MKKLILTLDGGSSIKIGLLESKAPQTIAMLTSSLPQAVKLMHARFNGEAIFFGANFVEGDLPVENDVAGEKMNPGAVSFWRGGGSFGGKAVHFWYGPRVSGTTTENVFGMLEGDLQQFSSLGFQIWQEGPLQGTVAIVEE